MFLFFFFVGCALVQIPDVILRMYDFLKKRKGVGTMKKSIRQTCQSRKAIGKFDRFMEADSIIDKGKQPIVNMNRNDDVSVKMFKKQLDNHETRIDGIEKLIKNE
jgi:hypothetical protein